MRWKKLQQCYSAVVASAVALCILAKLIFYRKPPEGCKYLRELHFNPQATSATINPVMPRVVAYILRQLKLLRICDFERLADGIQYYLHGPEGGYHPRKCTLANLKLTHFRGPSDNLTEEMLQVEYFTIFAVEKEKKCISSVFFFNSSLYFQPKMDDDRIRSLGKQRYCGRKNSKNTHF